MIVYIFTDGASKGNPGPGGWGAVIDSPEKIIEIGGGEKQTTNNRMEMTAALKALEKTKKEFPRKEVKIFSDSSYLINGITNWIFSWQKNDWKNSKKEPVLNADLWQSLLENIENRKIVWQYVPGHSDVAGNERANDIAEEFGFGKEPALYNGAREKYAISLLSKDGQPLDRKGKISQLKKKTSGNNSGKAYSYVSLVDNKIEIHKTWLECQSRVNGRQALFRKALSKEDEREIVTEFEKRKNS